VAISVNKEAPSFILSDASGKTRVSLDLYDNQPALQLLDERMQKRAVLSTVPDGGVGLFLYGSKGGSRAVLHTLETPTLVLVGKDRRVLWSAP
jgi:hypothetical protein